MNIWMGNGAKLKDIRADRLLLQRRCCYSNIVHISEFECCHRLSCHMNRKVSKVKEYFEKREKRLEFYHRALMISLIVFLFLVIISHLGLAGSIIVLAAGMIALFCIFAFGFINFAFSSEYKSIKWMRKKYDIDYLVKGIDLNACPTLPDSNIYCGDNAFASVGTGRIKLIGLIPYDAPKWVYVSKLYIAGGLKKAGDSFNILCEDGVHYGIAANRKDINYLFANYITASSRDLIIGYGVQERKKYLQTLSKQQRMVYCIKHFFNLE